MKKIISCCGFGNTGSSIITDFFREFSCVDCSLGDSQFEFTLLHEADGIFDLENALAEGNRLKTDLAIKRFLALVDRLESKNPAGPSYSKYFNGRFLTHTHNFLSDLGVVAWDNGGWHRAFECERQSRLVRFAASEKFNQLLKKSGYTLYESDGWHPTYMPKTKQYFGFVSRSDFKGAVRRYFESLFSEYETDKEYVLLDQLFPANVGGSYLDYFDDARAIIVDRDPRDLYFANKIFWGSGYIPTDDVETFISWFKKTRQAVHQDSRIMAVRFESVVYEPDITLQRICEFVGLDKSLHDKKNTCLLLERSKGNTRFFDRFLIADSSYQEQLKDDLALIEQELFPFLFDFSAYGQIEEDEKKTQVHIIEKKLDEVHQIQWNYHPLFVLYACCKKVLAKVWARYGK